MWALIPLMLLQSDIFWSGTVIASAHKSNLTISYLQYLRIPPSPKTPKTKNFKTATWDVIFYVFICSVQFPKI